MASEKVKICLKKKNPPWAQISRYFRNESRNNNALSQSYENCEVNKTARISGQSHESSECPLIHVE